MPVYLDTPDGRKRITAWSMGRSLVELEPEDGWPRYKHGQDVVLRLELADCDTEAESEFDNTEMCLALADHLAQVSKSLLSESAAQGE